MPLIPIIQHEVDCLISACVFEIVESVAPTDSLSPVSTDPIAVNRELLWIASTQTLY